MRPLEQIASEIRRITTSVVTASDRATLICTIDGTASGVPGAFADALDRADRSGRSSEALHELLVEYARGTTTPERGVPTAVLLHFSSGETIISTQ